MGETHPRKLVIELSIDALLYETMPVTVMRSLVAVYATNTATSAETIGEISAVNSTVRPKQAL